MTAATAGMASLVVAVVAAARPAVLVWFQVMAETAAQAA
jgi:hypothetical protein